ncbi:BDR-repeat family protein (plasmid) [Borrelia coriaceae ATCC 43381]|uniref:BDR-repeat family protein n=1 Tax=Borrelia coriaceae ATCC 43381 TaxID=1408429 RepID=W5SYL2_9SPIR|nr:BDR-repeat family protein [Borrelia coriaceae ATCC 43381]
MQFQQIKAGIDRDIAIDLSYRYYRNELTYKDIEYLENTFNLKLEKVESNLKSDIKDLDNKIDNVRKDIEINKMEFRSTLKVHNWMLGTIITICVGILLTLIFK